MKKIIVLMLVFLFISKLAAANILYFDNRDSFESSGLIKENYGFEDFTNKPYDGSFYWELPRNWTSHGVTYYSHDNFIKPAPSGAYRLGSNVFVRNYFENISTTIDQTPEYSLFGLDLAYVNIDSNDFNSVNLYITSNLSNYSFYDVDLSRAPEMNFFGFGFDNGNEFFKGFTISPQGNPSSFRVVLDNVTLGNFIQPVPEPISLFFVGFGLCFLLKLKNKV